MVHGGIIQKSKPPQHPHPHTLNTPTTNHPTPELLASFGSDAAAVQSALDTLVAEGTIARVGATLQLRDRAALARRPPASRVNIRSISSEVYRMVEERSGKVLETIEGDKAFYVRTLRANMRGMGHEGCV